MAGVVRRVVVAVVTVLTLTACGSSDGAEPEASSASGVVVDIAVENGTVTPTAGRVDVKVGQKVTLHVTSDADEEVHVHSEPEHEYELAPGDDKTYSFRLKVPGQVAVEAHHLDVTAVRLIVTP
jgi:major membrane immunogen (membrane-anchored lipoprotein)